MSGGGPGFRPPILADVTAIVATMAKSTMIPLILRFL